MISYEPKKGNLYHAYPTLVAVITTQSGGKFNVMSCAWHTYLSFDPPLYGVSISPERLSHTHIMESHEFCINFLPFSKAHKIILYGRFSGKDMDKFNRFKIQTVSPKVISCPILKDSYFAYECKVVNNFHVGDHTLFVGEILYIHEIDGGVDKDGIVDVAVCKPALYLGKNRYLKIEDFSVVKIDPEFAMQIFESEKTLNEGEKV